MDEIIATLTRARELDRLGQQHAMERNVAAASRAWTDCATALTDATRATTLALAEILERAAGAALQAGQLAPGLALAGEAVARLRGARASGALDDPGLAGRLGGVSMLYCIVQRWDDAVPLLAEAEALFAASEARATTEFRRHRASVCGALASAYHFQGLQPAALAVLYPALDRADALAEATGAPQDRIEAAHLRNTLGRILLEEGESAAAVPVLRAGTVGLRAMAAGDRQPGLINLLAAVLNRLGHAQAALGDRAQAMESLDESVGLMRALVEGQGLSDLAEDLRTAEQDLARLRDGH